MSEFCTADVVADFDRFVVGNYRRNPVVFVRGEGLTLWDADDRAYLDLFSGWGVSGLGYGHPAVVEAIRRQAGTLIHVPNHYMNPWQGMLAARLSKAAFGGQTFFCNSGAEAAEAALKLARISTGKKNPRVITLIDSFHGRTMGALAATGQSVYQAGFEPLVPGFDHVALNDLAAVERAMRPETCAIFVEPIQGEGGVKPLSREFLQGLRKLADGKGTLLMFDEVQTGMGRTGRMFGYQHAGVTPDVMTLAKSLGGGVAIGAIHARADLAAHLKPGTHASTFGGNPLACAAALAVFDVLESPGFLEGVRARSDRAFARLRAFAAKTPVVNEVRGAGMMIGIECARDATPVFARCLEQRVLVNVTHKTIVRLLPALIATDAQLDEGLAVVEKAISEL